MATRWWIWQPRRLEKQINLIHFKTFYIGRLLLRWMDHFEFQVRTSSHSFESLENNLQLLSVHFCPLCSTTAVELSHSICSMLVRQSQVTLVTCHHHHQVTRTGKCADIRNGFWGARVAYCWAFTFFLVGNVLLLYVSLFLETFFKTHVLYFSCEPCCLSSVFSSFTANFIFSSNH